MANKPAPKKKVTGTNRPVMPMMNKITSAPKGTKGNKPGAAKGGVATPRPARPDTGMIPDRSKQVQSFLKKYSAGAR